MPVYTYKGVADTGRSTRGFVDAESARAARAKLRRDGITPVEVVEGGRSSTLQATSASARSLKLPSLRRISGIDLAIATRQLATLIGAGIPLVDALSALSEQVESSRLKAVVGSVRDKVNEGASLADALEQSGPFSALYVSMVRAGETGGALEQVLARLADYLEGQQRLRNKVISIIAYPLTMLGFALVVVAALVTVVLPQITELLASLNQPLPFYTRIIMSASEVARSWWWAFALGGVAAAVGLRAAVQTRRGRELYDRWKLRIPVLGRVARLLAVSRFTRTLGTLLSGAIPITRSLDIAKHVTNNVVIGQAIDRARESITEGASLAAPLRASGHFPPLVTHMVEVGEQSGELEAMLVKVADTYDEQVETSVQRFTALLEPLLILIMVGIVLVIILATLVPLLQITSSLQ
jgi:general secretion pathway protein F